MAAAISVAMTLVVAVGLATWLLVSTIQQNREPAGGEQAAFAERQQLIRSDVGQLAQTLLDAAIREDTAAVLAFIYEPLLNAAGGSSDSEQWVKEFVSGTQIADFRLLRGEVGTIGEPLDNRGYTFVLVPLTTRHQRPNGAELIRRSHLLGISRDRLTWKFANCSANNHFLRRVLPEIPASMELPAPQLREH
jgi:hypothetical protein